MPDKNEAEEVAREEKPEPGDTAPEGTPAPDNRLETVHPPEETTPRLEEEPETEAAPSTEETGPAEEAEAEKTGLVSSLGKFLPRIIGLAVVGLLIVAVIFLYSRTKSQAARIAEETKRREEVELQVTTLEQDLTDKLDRINAIQNELKTVEEKRDIFEFELNSLKTTQGQLKDQLENAAGYQKTLEERLKAEQQMVAALQQKVDEDWDKQKTLFNKIESLMEEKVSLQEKLLRLQKSSPGSADVTMPKLVVTDVKRQAAPGALQGTILAVNRRYDFVVFNLGKKDGVKAGDRLDVLDGGKRIGEVVARRVLPAMTVADIDLEKTDRRLKKNFTVAFHE